MSYTYNSLGQRVEKKVGSVYTEYVYGANGGWLVAGEWIAACAGTTTREVVMPAHPICFQRADLA